MEEFIKLENIYYSFGANLVLNDVSETIYKQEAFIIIGSSGSGKSTFLKVCSGLNRPDSGRIFYNGEDISNAGKTKLMNIHKRAGYVFQNAALINNMCVFDNLALPLRYHSECSAKTVTEKVNSILNIIGLEKEQKHFPAQLSLGERKLVAMGRVLVMEPEIIFYDEPLASLDPISAEKVSWLINDFIERKITSIIITHRMSFAEKFASRIAIMHDGKIIECGEYDDIKASKNEYVHSILRSTI